MGRRNQERQRVPAGVLTGRAGEVPRPRLQRARPERVGGRADLLEPTEAPDHATVVAALRDKYPQYVAHDLETRPIIRIAIERVTSWGDLGGA